MFPDASGLRREADLAGRRLALPRGAGVESVMRYSVGQIVWTASATATAESVCSGAADAGIIATMYLPQLLLAPPRVVRTSA
jgi:ABC-type nitrate/sulfonate/bicarbonate transport system substrate-binding protein